MASIIKVDQIQTAAGGTPTAADLGINTTGSVLQVVAVSYNPSSDNTTSSNAYVDSGYTALTITPKAAGSSFKITHHGLISHVNPSSGGVNKGCAYRLYYKINSGSYAYVNSGKDFAIYKTSGSDWIEATQHSEAFHSPSYSLGDTITYQLFARKSGNTTTAYIHHTGGIELYTGEDDSVTFTAMEIAG